MGKRAAIGAAAIANRIRQNRGRGFGADFQPWVKVHDLPSLGLCSRIKYNGRTAHYLSGLEKQAAFDFRWNPAVIDIREQTRVDTEHTLAIAREMGVEHPVDIKTKGPFVCSTDFHLTVRGVDGIEREVARSVKPVADLELGVARTDDRRRKVMATLIKLEIERRYWVGLGVDWALVTDKDLSAVRCSNIQTMIDRELDPGRPEGFWQGAVQLVCEAIAACDGNTLDDVAKGLASDGRLYPADFFSVVIWLCGTRHLSFDLDRRLDLLRPVSDFTFGRPEPVVIQEAA